MASMRLDWLNLECPFCGRPFLKGELPEAVQCPCGKSFSRRERLLNLTEGDYFFDEGYSSETIRTLVENMERQGWEKAFEEFMAPLSLDERRGLAIRIFDETRAVWKWLLPLGKDAVALDIGCGWGSTTINLARMCRGAVGIEVSEGRIRAAEARARSMGIHNAAWLLAGNTPRLPFADESFDAVVLNGVLEWVPTSRPGKPEDTQREYLLEIRRILKPGGAVYVGIENRWGYRYFGGRREEHAHLRFISLMPRWMANVYSYLMRGKGYRNRTYSYGGYKELFRKAGYDDADIFYPFKNYVSIQHVHNDCTLPRYFAQQIKKHWKVVSFKPPVAWARALAPSYFIIGAKGKSELLLDRVLRAAESHAPAPKPASETPGRKSFTRFSVSPSSHTAVVVTPSVVVRLPLTPKGEDICRRRARALGVAGGDGVSSRLLPKALHAGEESGTPFFVENFLEGESLHDFLARRPSEKNVRAARESVLAFSLPFHRKNLRREKMTRAMFAERVEAPFRAVMRYFSPDSRLPSEADRLTENLARLVGEMEISSSFVHGDLWPGNVLVAPGGEVRGVLDWSEFTENGWALLDVVCFAVHWHAARKRLKWDRAMARMLFPLSAERLSEDEKALFRPYDEAGILPLAHLPAAGLLYAVDFLHRHTAELGSFEASSKSLRHLRRIWRETKTFLGQPLP